MGHKPGHVDPPPETLKVGLIISFIGLILALVGFNQLLIRYRNSLESNSKVNLKGLGAEQIGHS